MLEDQILKLCVEMLGTQNGALKMIPTHHSEMFQVSLKELVFHTSQQSSRNWEGNYNQQNDEHEQKRNEEQKKKTPRLAMSLLIDIAQCCKIIFRNVLKFYFTFCVIELLPVIQEEQKWNKRLTNKVKIGIFLPKLFWPTVRKKCSSDREKLQNFWDH